MLIWILVYWYHSYENTCTFMCGISKYFPRGGGVRRIIFLSGVGGGGLRSIFGNFSVELHGKEKNEFSRGPPPLISLLDPRAWHSTKLKYIYSSHNTLWFRYIHVYNEFGDIIELIIPLMKIQKLMIINFHGIIIKTLG